MLRCNHSSADRAPAITWERLDGMPISQVRFEVGGRSGEILRIIFAEEADSGVYVCRVTSFQGVQTGTAQVFVGEFINQNSVSYLYKICSSTAGALYTKNVSFFVY